MIVEVIDGNFFRAAVHGLQHSNSNAVEITKAHRLISRRMMSGGTHEAESILSTARQFERQEGRASRRLCPLDDSRMKSGIRIEILRQLQPLEVRRRMRAEQ